LDGYFTTHTALQFFIFYTELNAVFYCTLTPRREAEMSQIHIRYEGVSMDMDLDQRDLDVGDLSTDEQVIDAVALHLENEGYADARRKLANFNIDRNETSGDMTLRPQAVFG
jgi:hypothetical protein